MASVFFRGSKTAPRWFARFKSAQGKWVSKRVRQENRRDALRVAQALEARAERQRLGLEAPDQASALAGPLMRKWAAGLSNRSRDVDLGRVDKHLMPRWASVRITDVTLAAIMGWLDDMRDTAEIGPGSQRHALGLLSRFFSWCIERGHAQRNPVRDIPPGRRPRAVPPQNVPWIRDDGQVLVIMRALTLPFSLIFYVGNRSGLRLSEITALRLSDLDELEDGVVRVRHAGDDGCGPLKEDKTGGGKVKYVPAPSDAIAVLGPHLERRRAVGAGAEDLVFVDQDGEHIDRHAIAFRWRVVAKELGLPPGLNFYRGTRHSFVSRASAAGASIDEVASAVGHSSTATTLRHYMHFTRKRWSAALHAGLGLDAGAPVARVIAMSTPAAPPEDVDEVSVPAKPGKAGHAA